MKKRVLSMFMALALCLTLLPTAAFAEGFVPSSVNVKSIGIVLPSVVPS